MRERLSFTTQVERKNKYENVCRQYKIAFKLNECIIIANNICIKTNYFAHLCIFPIGIFCSLKG